MTADIESFEIVIIELILTAIDRIDPDFPVYLFISRFYLQVDCWNTRRASARCLTHDEQLLLCEQSIVKSR